MPTKPRSRLARAARALAIGMIPLCALEVALQVVALGVWAFTPRHDDQIGPEDRVVLCVGDSFTYGLGASTLEHSYPSQLEKILRDRLGPEWRVINGGWPSQNSHHVLTFIDEQIGRYRPEFVSVIVGYNDLWSHPAVAEPGPISPAGGEDRFFRWELRTLRLWKALTGTSAMASSTADTEKAPDADFLLGTWTQARQIELTFRADGTGELSSLPFAWEMNDGVVAMHLEDRTIEFTWKMVGEDLLVRSHGLGVTTIPVHGVPQPIELRFLRKGSERLPKDELETVYASNLRQIAERVAAHGARALIVDYPHTESWTRPIMSRIATELEGTDFVPLEEVFREAAEADPATDLFVPDTHCSDAGYRIMAEEIAARLIARVNGK